MFCKNCGAPVADGMNFCASCGTRVTPEPTYTAPTPEEPMFTAPQPTYEAPTYAAPMYAPGAAEAAEEASIGVLVWGILGLVFSLTILGIIFSAISLGKAASCDKLYGFLPTKARVGKGLGIGGLVISILTTLIIVVFIVVVIVTAGALVQNGAISFLP